MNAAQLEALTYWYRAMEASLGLRIKAPNALSIKTIMYEVRKAIKDPSLFDFEIVEMGSDEILVVRKCLGLRRQSR